jgi:hypothetical protein
MGRPPVLPKKKKDGFYLELRNKGAKTGIIVNSRHKGSDDAGCQTI